MIRLLTAALLLPVFALTAAAPAREPERAAPDPPAAGEAEGSPESGPPALTEYRGRTIAVTMHWSGAEWLLRRNREDEENAARMLEELRIQPGWTIADIGCGNGYHALTMAVKTGGSGRILAVDIQPQMLEMLQARAAGRGIRNIETITGKPWDPMLPPASCDLILLVDVYHEFSHPEHMLRAIRAALKPGGQVALVEFRSEDESVPIKPEHKMSKEQIRREWLPMGFEIVREFDELPWQHLIFLRSTPDGAKPDKSGKEPAPESTPKKN